MQRRLMVLVVAGRATWRPRRSAGLLLLSLVTLLGCVPAGDEREVAGVARIEFDGTVVGVTKNSEIKCLSRSDGGPPWFIKTRDSRFTIGGDRFQDWFVPRNRRADLHLQVSPGSYPEASVRFALGGSVYRSQADTSTEVKPDWEAGRVIFTDLPHVEGAQYKGRRQLNRLDIRWGCLTGRAGAEATVLAPAMFGIGSLKPRVPAGTGTSRPVTRPLHRVGSP